MITKKITIIKNSESGEPYFYSAGSGSGTAIGHEGWSGKCFGGGFSFAAVNEMRGTGGLKFIGIGKFDLSILEYEICKTQ